MKHLYSFYHATGGAIIVAIVTIIAFFAFMRGPEETEEKILQQQPQESSDFALPPAQSLDFDEYQTGTGSVTFETAAGECSSTSSGMNSEEKKFLSLINNYRQQNGKAPLEASGLLNNMAANLAEDMAANKYMSHTDSQGRGLTARAGDCLSGYTSIKENVARANSAQHAFDMWRTSAGHNVNMLSETEAIGIAEVNGYWATPFAFPNPGGTVTDDNSPTATPLPTNPPATCDTAAQQQGFNTFEAYCTANNQCVGNSSNNGGTLSCSCVPCAGPTASPTPTTFPGTITATPQTSIAPSQGNIEFSVILAGIGPNEGAGQNSLPNSAKNGVAEFTNISTQEKIERHNLTFVYDPQSGTFKGAAELTIQGAYEVRLRLNNTLWKTVGLVEVTGNQTSNLPQATLISGDTNQDNVLDLRDYNTILPCVRVSHCQNMTQTDFNMDGEVNEEDLNIFYDSLANRMGD